MPKAPGGNSGRFFVRALPSQMHPARGVQTSEGRFRGVEGSGRRGRETFGPVSFETTRGYVIL